MNTPNQTNPLAPIEALLQDPTILDIMIDGHDRVYVQRKEQPERVFEDVPSPFADEEALMAMITAMTQFVGQPVDQARPIVDIRWSDNSRIHLVIPPIAPAGPALMISKMPFTTWTFDDLIHLGVLNEAIATFLQACVRGKLNILMSGGPSSGKTTVLTVVARTIPDTERVFILQPTADLQLPHKYLVTLEARPPDTEGRGEITMSQLIQSALRMRPDRLILSEIQGNEVLDLLNVLNASHHGAIFGMHATSPRDALARMELMATAVNPSLPLLNVRQQIATAIDIIVYQERQADGRRRILKVAEVQGMQGDAVSLTHIFEFQATATTAGKIQGRYLPTGQIPKNLHRLRLAGADLPLSLFTPE
jgi:pilus assembly protein CpaF